MQIELEGSWILSLLLYIYILLVTDLGAFYAPRNVDTITRPESQE